jgi:hypothetical protein
VVTRARGTRQGVRWLTNGLKVLFCDATVVLVQSWDSHAWSENSFPLCTSTACSLAVSCAGVLPPFSAHAERVFVRTSFSADSLLILALVQVVSALLPLFSPALPETQLCEGSRGA